MKTRSGSIARRMTLGLVACTGLAYAPALADTTDVLAPPGPCAEPREAPRAEPIEADDAFDVSGSPLRHFDPRNVAASGGGSRGADVDAPQPIDAPRAPCDSPDAGCFKPFERPTLKESPVDPSCPPGVNC